MARADVRIRIRGGVIRVRIGETRIRPVIRITAEQHTSERPTCILSLEPKAVTASSESYFSREFPEFLDFTQDIENILRTREKFLSL